MLGGEHRRLEGELDRHPEHIEIGEVHDLAVEIVAPVAVDDAGQEQPGDQEEVRHAERLGERDQRMHPAFAAGGRLDAERRVHHHHHDDAEALGVVDPVDPPGVRRAHRPSPVRRHCRRGSGFIEVYATRRNGCVDVPPSPARKASAKRPRPARGRTVNHVRRLRMRVAMIGTGYVGLVSGACFADFGHHVTCVDKDAGKIAALKRGEMPIYEPGLDELVAANVRAGPADASPPISKAPVARGRRGVHRGRHAVAPRRRPRRPDLRLCRGARDRRARSTASPWSSPNRPCRSAPATRSSASSARRGPDAEFAVVSNPEFLREGAAIQDFKHPDRIVVGTEDERARAR